MSKSLWWVDLDKRRVEKFRRSVYESTTWRQCRSAILNNEPFCVHCTEQGRTTPAIDIDHIVNLTEIYRSGNFDLAFDLDNLQGLCKQCHGIKTRKQ